MNRFLKILVLSIFAAFLCVGNTMALQLGTNITISDAVNTGATWYSDREDQEVEPNCVTGQQWDLEGFFLKGNTLTMVGGYDFVNGGYSSGDIFIATKTPQYGATNTGTGSGNSIVSNSFGYDYVLDMNFGTQTYTIYSIDGSTQVETVFYAQNDESNAWRYYEGGSVVGEDSYGFGYHTGLNDGDVGGLLGDSHNAVVVDLSFLGADTEFWAHFTMGCGNDNLMGTTAPVPEPATMLLLGVGLIGIAGLGRKKLIKKQ